MQHSLPMLSFLIWMVVVTFATLPVHHYLEGLKAKNARSKRISRMLNAQYYTALVVSRIVLVIWHLK